MADKNITTGLTKTTNLTTGDYMYAVDGGNSRGILFEDVLASLETLGGLYKSGGTDVAVADGGTGASTAADARANLGIHDLGPNAQTGTSYTLVLADRGQTITMNNAASNTLTIPTNASVAFDVGTCVSVIQIGAGVTTIQGDTGVTVNGVSAGSGAINNRYQGVSLLKVGSDTWIASGDIATVA